MKFDVTIGIPVYRSEQYVSRALESALSQSYASIEFLVVDDGGDDRSMEVIYDLQKNHRRGKDVRVICHQENLGVSASRNDIIKQAQGDYLYFMDSDDVIADNTISLLMKKTRQFNAEIAFGSYEKIEVSGVRTVWQYPDIQLIGEDKLALFAFRKYAGIQASACNYLVKTSLLRDNKLYFIDTNYWEDMVFTTQLVTFISRAVLLPDITYTYCCRENSLSHYQERLSISKEEIFKNVSAVDYLKKNSSSLQHKPYYPNWCYNLVMTGFYIACNVLKRRDVISPSVTNAEIRSMLSHPATIRQICMFRQSCLKNLVLYFLCKSPSFLCVFLIKMIRKAKKSI